MHRTCNFSRFRKFLFGVLIVALCLTSQIFCNSYSNAALAAKKHQNTPYQEYLYQQKVLIKIEKAKYKRSLLPQSGFMTKAEYEDLSKDVPTLDKVIPGPTLPKDIKMKYIPQPVFKIVRYNDPPGSPEIALDRRFKFDRQENGKGITSPDKTILVYPAIYYYVNSQSTACDLFVIPLDSTLPEVERISRANVVKRNPTAILSTDKSISQTYTFKTMTPIDFSPDGSKLIAKEKIGNVYDGIWKTNLWVYDFETKTAKNIVEVRDAIRFYWLNTKGTVLDDKRWDIYPLGFDANDSSRIVVNAYGYTGTTPKFLGTWSVDCKGERSQLISLFNPSAEISTNGFKLVKSGVINPTDIITDEKAQDKLIKQKRKTEKKAVKLDKKEGKKALNNRIKEIKKHEDIEKDLYKQHQRVSAPTSAE